MTRSNKKLMSLVVAVMYALCILVAAPVQAYAVTGHNVAAVKYTTAQKNAATKTALAALAKLPANAAAAAKYTESASLQKLVTAADKALATAKKMKLATTKFKNYGRLAIAKTAVAALVAAEKKVADEKAAEADKVAAEAVVAKIKLIPEKVTVADAATVKAAKTAYDALTENGKKLVTNAATLTAAVAKLAEMDVTFSVTSVKASSAKTFKVVFSKAVPDTAKIVFEVKKMNTPVVVTATWNEAKTEATLTGASAFSEATYSVNVKNDTTDLGTSNVTITSQKIGKIQIMSTKLAISADGTEGWATYKVFDQYENDVTKSYLDKMITWNAIGLTKAQDGLIYIKSNTSGTGTQVPNLRTLMSVSITGYENGSGASVTANLTIAPTMGTLSDFKLGNYDNVKLNADDKTSVWYLPYTAKDLDGNEVTNYELIRAGMNFMDGTAKESLATSSYVTIKLVKDPADSKKAAIELKIKGDLALQITDLPIVCSISTSNGITAQFNTTLYKDKQVATVVLMAPTDVVAEGDTNVVVPFEAYDQTGKKMTKYSDLNRDVTFTNIKKVEKSDGTMELRIADATMSAARDKGTISLTATVTNSGKVSQLNLTVQKAAYANSLALDESVFYSCMEKRANFSVDLGWDKGGLSIKDQYDRDINMVTDGKYTSGTNYYAIAVSSSDVVVPVDSTEYYGRNHALVDASGDIVKASVDSAYKSYLKGGSDQITFIATAKGAATVRFTLYKESGNTAGFDANDTNVDSRSYNIAVVNPDEVTDFVAETSTSPIYVTGASSLALATKQQKAWDAEIDLFGKTSGGSKVKLAENETVVADADSSTGYSASASLVSAVSVSNTDEFFAETTYGNYDSYVDAKPLVDKTKTSASTTVTINLVHDNKSKAVTATVTSSTELPKITAVVLGVKPGKWDKMTVDDETYTVKTADLAALGFMTGNYVVRYNKATGAEFGWFDGSTPGKRAAVYFRAKDQYGCKANNFAQITMAKYSNTGITVANDGLLTVTPGTTGEYTFSAITNNGLVKNFKLVVTP